MAVQKCPQCGYELQPFETQCPKCKLSGAQVPPKPAGATQHPKPSPKPAPQPAPRAPATSAARADSEQQVCESCKGKYSVELAICPYCRHKSNLERHVQGVKITLEQERTIIGSVGSVLLIAACIFGFWVFKYQGEEIEYRVLGLKDFQLTVETRVLARNGQRMRLAGRSTYWFKPGKLRLDLQSGDDPVDRPITRLARLGNGEMITLDPVAGVCFAQSYSPEALQAPVISETATPNSQPVAAPASWRPSSTQPLFSLLGSVPLGSTWPPTQLVQAPAKTPEPAAGPARSYKLENLGRESINGFPTIHYRLTTAVTAKGCAGLGDGQEVTEYWVVPNLNGRFFEEEPAESRSGGTSSGGKWDDETAGPTPTPDPKAEPTPTPTPEPSGPKAGPTPLPIPTPYSPAASIASRRPLLALTPTPADACTVDNLRSGDETDFQNLYKGLVLRMRMYKGKTLVVEQEVKKFKRMSLDNEIFSADKYPMVDAATFWAKRAAPPPKPTETAVPGPSPQATATAAGTPAATGTPMASGTPGAADAKTPGPTPTPEITRP